MVRRKDDARNHRRECDVRRAWNGPSAAQVRSPEGRGQGNVDQRRRGHAAKGGGKWREGSPRRVERTAGQSGFEYFFRRECKEEHHADVVNPEMQWRCDMLVAFDVKIGPGHCRDRAGHEQQRIVDDEREEAADRPAGQPVQNESSRSCDREDGGPTIRCPATRSAAPLPAERVSSVRDRQIAVTAPRRLLGASDHDAAPRPPSGERQLTIAVPPGDCFRAVHFRSAATRRRGPRGYP
jgi:hypothetical protein